MLIIPKFYAHNTSTCECYFCRDYMEKRKEEID